MGKYLDEIDLYPSELYEDQKRIVFSKETTGLLRKINKNFQRNINSKFGKIVVMLWPKGQIKKSSGLIPSFELDQMSNVAVINTEFDIEKYIEATDMSNRTRIACDIIRKEFERLPPELGLDGEIIVKILDEIGEFKGI